MKEKIIIFLVGLLIGAIISTGSIYFYTLAENKNQFNPQMQNGDFINRGERNPNEEMGNPPEKPDNNMEKMFN